MLSRDCDGCENHWACTRRFFKVKEGEKVYCPWGEAHLVDSNSQKNITPEWRTFK